MSVCLIYRASSKTNSLCYRDACSLIETVAIYVTECKDQLVTVLSPWDLICWMLHDKRTTYVNCNAVAA